MASWHCCLVLYSRPSNAIGLLAEGLHDTIIDDNTELQTAISHYRPLRSPIKSNNAANCEMVQTGAAADCRNRYQKKCTTISNKYASTVHQSFITKREHVAHLYTAILRSRQQQQHPSTTFIRRKNKLTKSTVHVHHSHWRVVGYNNDDFCVLSTWCNQTASHAQHGMRPTATE